MGPLVILLFACLFLPLTEQKPSYLITAPNVVHVGMDETITVQVFEAVTSVAITVYFKEQMGDAPDIIMSQNYTVVLNQMNNFTKVILVQVLPEKTSHLNFAREAQHVILVAEISAPFNVTSKAPIRLASRPYFIYIVTDKPIYTPDETVRYQIFTLDQELDPINCTVTVEVLDSEGTVLASVREQNRSNSVHIGEISIQSKMTGTYQIRAKVHENSEYQGLITFQVQNYEIKLDMRIIPDRWYYVVKDETFPVTIQVLNKLHNDLYSNVTFGMTTASGHRVPLPRLHQTHHIQNGTARVILYTTALSNSIEQNGGMDKFNRGTMYIIAEVTDRKGYNERKVLDNIPFRLSPYNISLSAIKPYFTPGAAFNLRISVTDLDGSPAANVPLRVSITIAGEKMLNATNNGLTDKIGELGFTFKVPPNAHNISITVVDNKDERLRKVVMKHHSDSKRYLHINVPCVLLYPGDIITVTLTAISQLDISDIHYYYYMVIGKGKILDFRRVERAPETTVQLPITQDMIPYFRIVAYYVLDYNGRKEIIADSLRIEVESLCDTKFQVDSALYKHEESYQLLLSVLSDSPAEVFVQAVDTWLKELNIQDTITKRKVFEDLNSYDFGLSYGSGSDTVGVFRDSGLYPFSNLMTVLPEPAVHGHPISPTFNGGSTRKVDPVPGNEPFRLISDIQPISSWDNQALNMPAEDGSEKRTVTIRQMEQATVHGHPISPTFNGSSMWKVDVVPGNETFRLISNIHPPSSWEIQALSMSAENGLCLAQRMLIRLDGGHSQPVISITVQTMESEAHLHGDDQLD
ncbi:complement C3-like isoform X2 [Heterodontus francisci]|uniref:complement C3-like isoform X2 n=1 Tax=Heterodontus francisci TaxID=7792 RepID=UPI00355B79C5